MVIGIIGGGASGMAAAIEASGNTNNQIIIFERQARVGRKLLATGNGRCNLSNLGVDVSHYHGDQPEFVQTALSTYNMDDTLNWFRRLGLITVSEPSGKVYPYSDQANSVVDILRFALDRPNIQLCTGVEVQKVKKLDGGFLVECTNQQYFCDRLIIACGGLAGTKLGGTMSGYKLLGKLGHKCTRLRPALVQLKSSWPGTVSLKGVRANCHVKILKDEQLFAESVGELQFTEYGLSGPVIFEVSRDVCHEAGQWYTEIDFLPQMGFEELFEELLDRKNTSLPVSELLTGILHNRLGRVLTQAAGIGTSGFVTDTDDAALRAVCSCVKAFRIDLTEPMGMDSAQVTAGGILTEQFYSETMESKLVPGLYACGEVLDIDGDCGGYNLQWAWSSGRLAGKSAGREEK